MKFVKLFFVQFQYTSAIWQSNADIYMYIPFTRMQLLILWPKSMELLMFVFVEGAGPSENVHCSACNCHHKGEMGLSSMAM